MKKFLIFLICIFMTVGSKATSRISKTVESVPEIASFLGYKVGVDTLENVEKKWGPGTAITGGHPQGARIWRDKSSGCWIYADAFDHSSRGWVLDNLKIGCSSSVLSHLCDHKTSIKTVKLKPNLTQWINGIRIGYRKGDVLKKLKDYPNPKVSGDLLVWSSKGYHRVNESTVYQSWKAVLTFRKDKLVMISVDAW